MPYTWHGCLSKYIGWMKHNPFIKQGEETLRQYCRGTDQPSAHRWMSLFFHKEADWALGTLSMKFTSSSMRSLSLNKEKKVMNTHTRIRETLHSNTVAKRNGLICFPPPQSYFSLLHINVGTILHKVEYKSSLLLNFHVKNSEYKWFNSPLKQAWLCSHL